MTDSWDSIALWGPGEGAEVSSFMREHRIVDSTVHAGTCELTHTRTSQGGEGAEKATRHFILAAYLGLKNWK